MAVAWRLIVRWLGLALLVVGVSAALFWPIADLLAQHDTRRATGPTRSAEVAKARDTARGHLVQWSTVLLGMGAIIFTARNFQLAREQSEVNRQPALRRAIRTPGAGSREGQE